MESSESNKHLDTKHLKGKFSTIHVQTPDEKQLDLSDMFVSKYDYLIKRDLYKAKDDLMIYNLIREIFCDKKNLLKIPVVTYSCDSTISSATISGATEHYMYMTKENKNGDKEVMKAKSKLRVIYLDQSLDCSINKVTNHNELCERVVSNAMGLFDESFTNHHVNLAPESIVYLGINEKTMNQDEKELIDSIQIEMYSLQIMRKKGIEKILNSLLKRFEYDPIYIVFDMSCCNYATAPSVYRYKQKEAMEGFDFREVDQIFKILKKHNEIYGIDITGYNFGEKELSTKNQLANQVTSRVIQMITEHFIEIKMSHINIFNEYSKFLIWRKVHDEDLIGWRILRNVGLEDREEFINAIEKNSEQDDGVKQKLYMQIYDDETDEAFDALVTYTTMDEQQGMSYFHAESLHDCVLLPGEKLNMMFELINTPQSMI
jgi:arginase family enzyme